MPRLKKKSSTTKKKSKTQKKSCPPSTYWINAQTQFRLPKGLVPLQNNDKVWIWKTHPWEKKPPPIINKGVRLTKGWGQDFPKKGLEREALALVSPQSFLAYEISSRKSYGKNCWRIFPKFPITPALPEKVENEILVNPENVKVKTFSKYIVIDRKGLNAARIRATQQLKKYGPSLLGLIKRLQKMAD